MQPEEKKKRGFASLSPEKLREISSRGGQYRGAKGFAGMTPERRKEISSQAAKVRWQRVKEERENAQPDS